MAKSSINQSNNITTICITNRKEFASQVLVQAKGLAHLSDLSIKKGLLGITLIFNAFLGNAVGSTVSGGYFTSADISGFVDYSMVINDGRSGNNLVENLSKNFSNNNSNLSGSSTANLSTGTLKSSFSSITWSTSGKLTGGSARTSFGDSFAHSTYSDTVFNWSPNGHGHFVFSVSGETSVHVDGQPSSLVDDGYAGGLIFLTLFQPDSLDACFPVSTESCGVLEQYAWGLSSADNEFFNDKSNTFESVTGFVDDGSLVDVELPFQGDFGWMLTITASAYSDGSGLAPGQEIIAYSDFSHTLAAYYVAPQGAVVNSASGVFPVSTPVPLPATFSLLGLGLAGLLGVARRRP